MKRRDFLIGSAGFIGFVATDSYAKTNHVPLSSEAVICRSSESVESALQQKGGDVIQIAPGDYYFAGTLNVTGRKLIGSGSEQTRLIFSGGKYDAFLQVNCDADPSTEIRDLSIVRGKGGGGIGILVERDVECYHKSRRRTIIENVTFRGIDIVRSNGGPISRQSWSCCIDIGDGWGTYVRDIDAIGGYDISVDTRQDDRSVFLRLGADNGILSARISGVTATSFYRAIEIGDKVFFFISDCDFAACYDGIISTHSKDRGFSEGRIRDTLINAQRIGIELYNTSWRSLEGIAINRHKAGYKIGDWTGIRLSSVSKSWIRGVRLQVDVSKGHFEGKNIGIEMYECKDIVISEVFYGHGLSCTILTKNTRGLVERDNITYSGGHCLGD